jgi:hypothetical protein
MLRLRTLAVPVFNTNSQSSCDVRSAADNAGDTPTVLKGISHGAECRAGWLPARFGRSLFNSSPSVGGGCPRGPSVLFLPRLSALVGDSGSTLGLVERARPADDCLLPLTLSLLAWRPRERSGDGRVSVPGSGSSGGATEGISISDQVFVNGEKGPVPVLRLRDDVERVKFPRIGSASSSSSGTASSLVTRSETTECAQDAERDAGPWAHVRVSWTILSNSHSASPEHELLVSESQPTDQLTSSTAAMVQR